MATESTTTTSQDRLECLAPRPCSSRFKRFREFSTITDGFHACELEGADALPFVVRAKELSVFKEDLKADVTSWPSQQAIRSQIRRESNIKGYQGSNNDVVRMSGIDTLTNFDSGKMTHNVIDSECTRSCTLLLSGEMVALSSQSRVEPEDWAAYVISPASNRCGQLHIDPPHGSNWQYLASGAKVWYAFDKRSFDLELYNEVREPGQPPDVKALSLKHDCYSTIIGPGDFVYTPLFWPHSINTTTPSIGLSGYGAIPTCMLSPRNSMSEDLDY